MKSLPTFVFMVWLLHRSTTRDVARSAGSCRKIECLSHCKHGKVDVDFGGVYRFASEIVCHVLRVDTYCTVSKRLLPACMSVIPW